MRCKTFETWIETFTYLCVSMSTAIILSLYFYFLSGVYLKL